MITRTFLTALQFAAFATMVAGCASGDHDGCRDFAAVGDYQEKSEKLFPKFLGKDESVFIQKDVHRCEKAFDESSTLQCGISVETNLVWMKSGQIVDRFALDSEGCEKPQTQAYASGRKPQTVDLTVENDSVAIRQTQDDHCQLEVVKIDRKAHKLLEEPQRKCHSM